MLYNFIDNGSEIVVNGVLTRGYEHGGGEYIEYLRRVRDDRWSKNDALKLYLGLDAHIPKEAGRLPKQTQSSRV